MRGINTVINSSDETIELYVEYMDVKRHLAAETLPYLESLYRYRYRDIELDAVIVSDDFALDFVLQYREKLFSNVPVIFCGINTYTPTRLLGQSGITGVVENTDITGTIQLALSLHPTTKNIAVISDGTSTGTLMMNQAKTAINQFASLTTIELFDLSVLDLTKALIDLPAHTIILHLHYYTDKGSGKSLSVRESFAASTINRKIPVYTAWDFQIGYGAIGGLVTNGERQGSSASEMATHILKGTSADDIPVMIQSPNTPMFDYRQLSSHGIDTNQLPDGSYIQYEPQSFYYKNLKAIWSISVTILVLVVFNIFLFQNVQKRKRVEQELNKHKENLEDMIKERTADIEKAMTESLQAQHELKESEDRFKMLFQQAPVGYQSLDENGNFIDVNDNWLEQLGYTRQEVIGKSFGDFLDPEWKSHFKENFPRFKTIGEILGVEFEIIRKDGSHVLMSINGKIGKNADGSFRQTHCVLHDITSQRAAEEEKEKLQEQLRQAQKMEAIGTLAGGIAHDFNNILTIIQGNTELVLQDLQPNNFSKECLGDILKASRRAKDLVQQILTFSRKKHVEKVPISPYTLLKESLKMLRSTTPTTVQIIDRVSSECRSIKADPTQLHQIIMNLFSNAVHSIDEKGVITVSLDEVELSRDDLKTYEKSGLLNNNASSSYAQLSVIDNGTGMTQETIDRIFDPFFTTKEFGQGSGMGLSVVHGIVNSHDGFITVDSTPGIGSAFHIFFPIVKDLEDTEKQEEFPFQGGSEHILLVDDEEQILELTKRLLHSLGYTVTSTNSSLKALKIFTATPDKFDLILSDQTMPEMAGTELISEILKIKPNFPSIICSGFSSKVSKDNIEQSGISRYIDKPYSKRVLAATVREILDSKPV
ncbi:ABC transporter substrate binding protein [Desulfosediminicola flagellatus]|uniref:hybrid sensor histidine kinase/response regulator n=1 Tax=Desulfosediminicola flagellatus TaxID=2569541 RepID=UPI00142EBA27|nr:ABC transporter substrate binding protein [Desulfosediminicola flagellatus]